MSNDKITQEKILEIQTPDTIVLCYKIHNIKPDPSQKRFEIEFHNNTRDSWLKNTQMLRDWGIVADISMTLKHNHIINDYSEKIRLLYFSWVRLNAIRSLFRAGGTTLTKHEQEFINAMFASNKTDLDFPDIFSKKYIKEKLR